MKKIGVALLILIAVALGGRAQEHTEKNNTPSASKSTSASTRNWTKHSSLQGRYSVLMPEQPKLSTQEAATADGLKFTQYLATAGAGPMCVIGYFDRLEGTTFDLDKARDGMVRGVNGSLVNESAISLGGHPGRELKIAAKSADGLAFTIQARIYEVNDRIYVVQFIFTNSSAGETTTEAARAYFDSFAVNTTQ